MLNALKNHFTTSDTIAFRTRGKRPVLKRTTKTVRLFEENSDRSIRIDAGLFEYLVYFFRQLKEKPVLKLDFPGIEPFQLSDKWTQILRDDQREDVYSLMRFFAGLSAHQ